MKSIPNKILSFLLYANIGKDKFHELYPNISKELCEENRKNVQIFSFTCIILFAVLFGVSFFSSVFMPFKWLYLVSCIFSAVIFFVNNGIKTDNLTISRVVVYVFVFAMLLFTILLGTWMSPDERATAFTALIITAPLLFVDRPIYFIALTLSTLTIFVVMAIIFDNPSVLVGDITNTLIFVVFSIVACIYTMNAKLRKYFLEQEIRVAADTDVLTGLKNRNCFERDLGAHDIALMNDTYFVYVDANGLHDTNNEQGHEAGDILLQKVASEVFAQFHLDAYRIGGDEFVAFGTGIAEADIVEKLAEIRKRVEEAGYSTSTGYALGKDYANAVELMKAAESDMFVMKMEYYKQKGLVRRYGNYIFKR